MEGGNPGRSFEESYNMETIEPVEGWQKMYEEVKQELAEMGIEF